MITCHSCGHDYEDGTLFCVHDGSPLKAATADLPAGTEVGEYRITHKLGQGAMGSVFAGVHPLIGKKVAVKVLNHDLCRDASMVQRFVQEARAVNRIGHPNIIDVFAFGTFPDGRHYYVMEMIEGQSLAALLDERRLTVPEARRLLAQLCEALAAAHAEGIIHRDLKPDNIFIAMPKHGESFVKVLDFGIAKLFSGEEAMTATRTGMPVGTPYYMSPEQIRAVKNIDHRTDIYALGVIMFEIFTGRVPFPRETVFEVFADHVGTMPPRPSSISPLPGQLDDLILRCLAKDPAQRPQSAREVGQALQKLLAGDGADLGVSATVAAAASGPQPATGAPAAATEVNMPPPQAGVVSTAAAVEAAMGQPRRSRVALVAGGAVVLAVVAVVAVVALGRSGKVDGTAGAAADAAAAPAPAAAARRAPDGGPRRTGVLRITTDVGVARFFLDGKNVAEGKTATLTDVEAGVHHELRAEAAGEPPQVLRVLVSEGGESVVEVTFRTGAPRPGAITPPPPRREGKTPPAAAGTPKAPTPAGPAAKAPEPPKVPAKPPAKKPAGRDDIADPF